MMEQWSSRHRGYCWKIVVIHIRLTAAAGNIEPGSNSRLHRGVRVVSSFERRLWQNPLQQAQHSAHCKRMHKVRCERMDMLSTKSSG